MYVYSILFQQELLFMFLNVILFYWVILFILICKLEQNTHVEDVTGPSLNLSNVAATSNY